jgi:hypothetical protein
MAKTTSSVTTSPTEEFSVGMSLGFNRRLINATALVVSSRYIAEVRLMVIGGVGPDHSAFRARTKMKAGMRDSS